VRLELVDISSMNAIASDFWETLWILSRIKSAIA